MDLLVTDENGNQREPNSLEKDIMECGRILYQNHDKKCKTSTDLDKEFERARQSLHNNENEISNAKLLEEMQKIGENITNSLAKLTEEQKAKNPSPFIKINPSDISIISEHNGFRELIQNFDPEYMNFVENGEREFLISKSEITDKLSLFGNASDRIDWDTYFLRIALNVAARSTCLRRKYGAVIVSQDHRIISTGYNGAASGEPNCSDKGKCYREELGVPHGERYELCVAVHAEANAIMKCNRTELIDSTIYIVGIDAENKLYGEPCKMCERLIKNSGIKKAIYLSELPAGEERNAWYDYEQGKVDLFGKIIMHEKLIR